MSSSFLSSTASATALALATLTCTTGTTVGTKCPQCLCSSYIGIANVLIVYEYNIEMPGSGYYKDDDVNTQKFQSSYFISTICSHG